jgi:multidrug efflux pump subunit AcrA (membrane-fusion protein)
MTKTSIATLVATLALVGLVGWMLGKGSKGPEKGAKPAVAYVAQMEPGVESMGISEVSQQRLLARTPMGGYVEPMQVVHITAQTGGRVVYIAGREGVSVLAGQVIVGLDEERLMPDYRAAWAHLSGEMSAVQNAQVQLYNKLNGPVASPMGGAPYDAYDKTTAPAYNVFRGMMPFLGGGAPLIAQSDQQRSYPTRSQARSEYERQMASVVASQSKIDTIESQMRDHRGIAPFPAIILAKHVAVGDVVQPGQALMDIAQTDRLQLKLEVPARLVTELHQGEIVPVTIEGNATVDGLVDQIFPAANSAQHTVTVKVLLPPSAPVAPGMYASALLPEPPVAGQAVNVPVIPVSAVVYPGSLPTVFTVGRDGKTELRVVRLGDKQGDRVIVLSGLQPGEKVVTSPSQTMRSGDPIIGERLQ